MKKKDYQIVHLDSRIKFEGCGDVIVHPEKNLIYGGHGFRSSIEAFPEISLHLDVPIVTLQLTDPRFYHLDTCFLPISEETVQIYPDAFSEESVEKIKNSFRDVVAIPEMEADSFFSLNAHCVFSEQQNVAILQSGTTETKRHLSEAGFEVIETDTSEFIKSGGSVFCLKMMWG